MRQEAKKQIEANLMKGDLQRAITLIKLECEKRESITKLKEIILVSCRLNYLNKELDQGLITYEIYSSSKVKIVKTIIELTFGGNKKLN